MIPQIYDFSIVIIGEFNPVIIQPQWLVNKKLIGEIEGESARIEIIHNEVVKFNLDWASFEVSRNRFQVRSSKQTHFISIKDLVIGIFRLLNETPLNKVGFNHMFHFTLDSKDYYEFGKKLAPFNNFENVLNDPRLLTIEMIDYEYVKNEGKYRVKISPSELLKSNGLSININNHYDSTSVNNNSTEVIDIIDDKWEFSFNKASDMCENLWKNLK